MARDYINEDIDSAPGKVQDAANTAKDIKNYITDRKGSGAANASGQNADTKPYSKPSANQPSGNAKVHSSPSASGGKTAASGASKGAAAGSSASGASAGGAASSGTAASSGAAAGGSAGGAASGAAAGPIGAAAGAATGVVSDLGNAMRGSGSAAASSAKGYSGAPRTSIDKENGALASVGALIGAKIAAKAVAVVASIGTAVIAAAPILIPVLLIASIIVGTSYHKEAMPPAVVNEARTATGDDLADLSNAELYQHWFSQYADVMTRIINESYEAKKAEAERLKGEYDTSISSLDETNKAVSVNAAKIVSAYSVYAGANASLAEFTTAVEGAKSRLISFTTEEVHETEDIPPVDVPDQTAVTVPVYDTETGTVTEETYYTVPGTTHPCEDGEQAYEAFEALTVKVASYDTNGNVDGYTEKTYYRPTAEEPTTFVCGPQTIDGIKITMNPVDENVLYALWPVDLNAIAPDRSITNAELIELYENTILSYGSVSVGSLPTIDPIGSADFQKLSAEINKFIGAQNSYGVTYVYGSDSPYTRMDCSSFVSRVFWNSGVARSALWPNTTSYYRHDCRTIYAACEKYGTVFTDTASLEPGDIMFMTNTQGENYIGKATHVLIYLGNGQLIEMCSTGITLSNISTRLSGSEWSRYFLAYGRLTN